MLCFVGVYLSFMGMLISNNSYVVIADIGEKVEGEGNNTLLCYTDNIQCCNDTFTTNTGQWILPGGNDME